MDIALFAAEINCNKMDFKQRHAKVQELRALRAIKQKEIELANIQLANIKNELFETEWIKMTWSELENWLKENRPQNDIEKNPIVISTNGFHISYCYINDYGELNIGYYRSNDNFPRDKDVLVAYDFKSWGNYKYGL